MFKVLLNFQSSITIFIYIFSATVKELWILLPVYRFSKFSFRYNFFSAMIMDTILKFPQKLCIIIPYCRFFFTSLWSYGVRVSSVVFACSNTYWYISKIISWYLCTTCIIINKNFICGPILKRQYKEKFKGVKECKFLVLVITGMFQ